MSGDIITSTGSHNTEEIEVPESTSLKTRTKSFDDISNVKTKKEKFKSRSYTLDQLFKKKQKKNSISIEPEVESLPVIPSVEETTASNTQIDLRSRLQNLAFIFSLPHLVMLSNLQKLIGLRTGKKPSIQPNDYMDNLLQNAKVTMKERGLNDVKLPDQDLGVALYNGKMTGLDNLSRSGDALLEAETDHFLLSFAIEANNIKANYWWKKQRLKGEVSAVVNQVTMKMQIKQAIQNSPPPELLAFTVEKIDGIHVSIYGLGPLNWIVRKVLRALLRRHLRDFLEREGRDVVQQELQNASLASEGDNLFTMLPQLVMY